MNKGSEKQESLQNDETNPDGQQKLAEKGQRLSVVRSHESPNSHVQPEHHHLPDPHKNASRLLSGLLAMNLIIVGCVLVSRYAFDKIQVQEAELLIFLSVLMLLTVAWMIVYLLYTSRKQVGQPHKDSHAGPIWLRGGLLLFGICSLILDVFKIGYNATLVNCDSAVSLVFPIIQMLFLIVQTYFLWISSQDCVQLHRSITRCGLMLTLTTNLLLWTAAVTEESLHQSEHSDHNPEKPGDNHSRITVWTQDMKAGGSSSQCECTQNICTIFQTGYFYLYPFNIEYSLFASCMSYVMWKNVGRVIHAHRHHAKLKFSIRGIVAGPILGIVVAISGLGIFIVYEVEVNFEALKGRALMMYYVFNIISLTLMSMSSLAGTIIYRFDKRSVDSHKNPSRTLDVALLLGAALGQYTISYYSVVAVAGSKDKTSFAILNLIYSLLKIIQHSVQNVFLIEGLQREPYQEEHNHGRSIQTLQVSLRDTDSTIYINNDAFSSFVNDNTMEPSSAKKHADASDNMFNGHNMIPADCMSSQIATVNSVPLQPSQLSWKRRSLKEISAFLLLSNIIFWIMPAFGARPQFDYELETNFYESIWYTIVNIGLPFGIFYRMHSVASLFEIYITS